MKSTSRNCFFLFGFMLAALAGCYSMSPYGPAGYPGPYSVPQGGAYPQGAYLTPNGFTANDATAAGLAPTYGVPGTQWQTRIETGASSPSFEAARSATGQELAQPSVNKQVPVPRDPQGAAKLPAGSRGTQYEESGGPLGTNPGAAIELRGVEDGTMTRIQQMGGTVSADVALESQIPMQSEQDLTDNADEAFVAPIPLKSISSSRGLVETQASVATPTTGPDPYDHDREHHTWLRGVVDYDQQDQSWHLIYDVAPDVNDPYGGDVTLLTHPQLETLKPGDVVLVEGRLDADQRDRLDKPSYHIDRCTALVPKP